MKRLKCADLRKAWIDYFKSKDHLHLPSASLLPEEDPTLLFTSAGMVPFKEYFNGTKEPPHSRIITIQKCLRTTDLESVGKTTRHCTFFEMLGNFSFGDYFKKEAIEYAYEFSTEFLEFPPEKIYVTVYYEDEEAFQIWNKNIGIPEEKIVRLGKEHNWWGPAGDSGPCGPCTELYLDRGEHICYTETGCKNPETCKPGNDCDRFLEYWNLVFNQYFQDTSGKLHPLPKTGIDTGAGLERIDALLNETDSVYETDELLKIKEYIEKIIKEEYHISLSNDYKIQAALRVLTDHIRSVTFAISDGIFPENTGRGYVIRRIIRRALLFANKLGIKKPILHQIHPVVVQIYKEFYPELLKNQNMVQEAIYNEELRFIDALEKGMRKWKEFIQQHKIKNQNVFDGEKAFILYDTYGFPFEMTVELAQLEGMTVDRKTFEEKMEEQRNQSRKLQSWKDFEFPPHFPYLNEKTLFTGYHQYEETGKILSIIYKDQLIKQIDSSFTDECIIIVDKTCFYPEGGGQIGDSGYIITENGKFRVIDTRKKGEIILHIGYMVDGFIQENENVRLMIDTQKREFLTYHHSATHLLNKALREVLGDYVYQTGSLVDSTYFRFDFSHNKKLTEEEIEKVERKVIDAIIAKAKVYEKIMPLEEAKKIDAIATFGEKYGEIVRIIQMGDKGEYSIEFCGGCHVQNTGDIKFFHIIKETSPGAGNRRIEAVANNYVIIYFEERLKYLKNLVNEFIKKYEHLKTEEAKKILNFENLPTKDEIIKKLSENPYSTRDIEKLLNQFEHQILEKEKQLRKLEKKSPQINNEVLIDFINKKIESGLDLNHIKIIHFVSDSFDVPTVRFITDKIKERVNNSLILCGIKTHTPILLFTCTKKVLEEKIDCNQLLKQVITIIEGNGGGKQDMAQGGGKNPEKLEEAIQKAIEIVKSTLLYV